MLVLAAAVGTVLVALVARTAAESRPLDPTGTGGSGARAVASVLADHGVDVTVARSLDAATSPSPGRGETVLVAGDALLSPDGLRRLVAAAAGPDGRGADRIVLLAPDQAHVDALDLGVDVLDGPPRDAPDAVPARCTGTTGTGDLVDPADHVTGASARYLPRGPLPAGAAACFRAGGAAVLLSLPATGQRPATVLFGAPAALTNDRVTEAANAATVLRLLGGSPHLVWYLPSAGDLAGGGEAAGSTGVPEWFAPVVAVLGVTTLAVALWRGRRLGRVVPEPLPALVPAGEATAIRARLYHRGGDRARSAQVLRAAARRRLAARLGVPPHAPADALVAAVARAGGLPAEDVADTLLGAPPPDDATMVSLARRCDEIEERVARR